MKQLRLFFLSLFIIAGTVASPIEYNGDQRQRTVVNTDGKKHVSLDNLEGAVNIIFSKDKNISEVLNDMKLSPPLDSEKCQDTTHSLNFTLFFDDHKYIDVTLVEKADENGNVAIYLAEECLSSENETYIKMGATVNKDRPFEDVGKCFEGENPLRSYDQDQSKNVMQLQSTPNEFECQVSLTLPEYMEVKEIVSTENVTTLNPTDRLPTSETVSTENSPIGVTSVFGSTGSVTNKDTSIPGATPGKTESAGFEWWWLLIIGVLLIIAIAVVIIIVYCMRRRQLQDQTEKDSQASRRVANDELPLPPSSKEPKKRKSIERPSDDLSIKRKSQRKKKSTDPPSDDPSIEPQVLSIF